MILIIHGLYRFRPRRLAFRNDFCLNCGQQRRSVQVRTFNAVHLFYIPIIPLGFWKRWLCSACGKEPHVLSKTRRSFKWAGLVVLVFFSVSFWIIPVDRDFVLRTWLIRVAAPIGAVLTLRHLLKTPKDPVLQEKLAMVSPANETACPFCRTQMIVGSVNQCPACGVVRA